MSNISLNISDLTSKGLFVDYRDPIWGDSYNWSWVRPLSQVQYLVIHHSVTSHNATPDDIALLHKARGWSGIGYHFVITKDGTVYYVGDIGTARANVLDMNEKVIGICIIGDFTQYKPSDAQITSAHLLCKFFITNYPNLNNVQSWDNMVGHKELQATACPGNDWKDNGDSMYYRIKENRPYGGNQLPSTGDTISVSKEDFERIRQKSDQYDQTVQYLEAGDPNHAMFETIKSIIAGIKSQITTLQNDIIDLSSKLGQANTEVANQKDKLANIESQCQREKDLLLAEIKALKESAPDIEKLKSEYMLKIEQLEGMLREEQKQGGLKDLEIAKWKSDFENLSKNQPASRKLALVYLNLFIKSLIKA